MVYLDLTGSPETDSRGWSVRFDGRLGERAAVAALLAGRFPVVDVVDATGQVITSGRPGSERQGIISAALDDVLAGCVPLVIAAVCGHPLRLPQGTVDVVGRAGSSIACSAGGANARERIGQAGLPHHVPHPALAGGLALRRR